MELPVDRQQTPFSVLRPAVLGVAILALAGCGQGSKANKTDQAQSSSAATAQTANASVAPLPAAPAIDPAKDTRPDRVKFDEFAGRLQAQQNAWLTADSQLIGTVRGALQKGSPAEARSVLAAYASTIQGELADLPPAPILSGCFTRAAGLDSARAAAAAALTARRDQAQPLLAISYRPLNLADFGPLASQTSGTQQQAQEIAATLTAAQAAVANCDAPGKTPPPAKAGRRETGRHHGPFGHYGPAPGAAVDPPLPPPPNPSHRLSPLTPAERASRAPEQYDAPPPKKSKNLLERLTHPFGP